MIGKIFKNRYENKEVEKTSGGPRNFIDKFNKEKGVVMKMLQSLKGKEFELDMHKIGFEAYDNPRRYADNTFRGIDKNFNLCTYTTNNDGSVTIVPDEDN